MAVTIDTFGASFIHYLDGVIEILNKEVAARRITKGSVKNWEGDRLRKSVHVARNNAVAAIEDGGSIPPSHRATYQWADAYRKFTVGHVGITDGALNNASSTEHAAISVVDSELRGMMNGLKCFQNYFWTRDGTGVVTLMGATVSGATITVDDARGLWDQASYSILDATTPTTVHETFKVQSVSRAYDNTLYSATVTPTASVTAAGQAADDYVVWGTGAHRSYNRTITGLDAGIDDAASTFQGIDASTWTKYTSPVLDNSSTRRAMTPALLRRMLSMLVQESGALPPDLTVLGSVWLLEKFDELYESSLRITPDVEVSGTATPAFQSSLGKVKLETDKDSPYGKLFFICPQEITFAVQKELHWRPATNSGGGGIFLRDDNNARYNATALEQAELFYEDRTKCGKIEDLEETVGTAF